MYELGPTPESLKVNRQEVIDAFKKFALAGITHPDNLDLDDPEVESANELHEKWIDQGGSDEGMSEEAQHIHNLDKTMIMVEAGFTDPSYLDEVLDWLNQDEQNAEEILDVTKRAKILELISTAKLKVKNLLNAVK